MINSIEEFKNKYPKAAVVNYDIASLYGYGLTYRTSTDSVEMFRRIDSKKYITYPNIQPYSKLDGTNYEIFIIRNNKMYKLEKGKANTFKIKKEILDVDTNIFDKFYYNRKSHIKPRNSEDETIYIIEE